MPISIFAGNVFDRLIAAATITFSKQNPVATIRGRLL